MRINGFHQITAFYSIVFNQEHDFKPQHISLYVFLINQNNRNNWVEWFKVPIDLGMAGSCIGSKKTYYACLDDLQNWGLLDYEKGENMWKAPKVRLVVLKVTSTYTSTVPQSEPLPIPLPDLNLPPYINLQPTTLNKKHNTAPSATPAIPSEIDFLAYYELELSAMFPNLSFSVKAKYEAWKDAGWKDGNGKKIANWKSKLKNTIPYLKPIAGNSKPQSDHRNNPDASLGAFRYKDRSEFPSDDDYIQNCKTYGHTINETSLLGI